MTTEIRQPAGQVVFAHRPQGALIPGIVLMPVFAMVIVSVWLTDRSNWVPLLLLVSPVMSTVARVRTYRSARRTDGRVVLSPDGVTWLTTGQTLAWSAIDSVRVRRPGVAWRWLGVATGVGLVDHHQASFAERARVRPMMHLIDLRCVEATVENLLDAIHRYAPWLADPSRSRR